MIADEVVVTRQAAKAAPEGTQGARLHLCFRLRIVRLTQKEGLAMMRDQVS